MAYEKAELVVDALSGEIYLTRINKDGSMSLNRMKMTESCLNATTE